MNKHDILMVIEKYNLPKNDFVILAGAALVMHGIKDKTKNLDIVVTPQLQQLLLDSCNNSIKCYNKEEKKNIYYIDNILNFSTNLSTIIDNSEYIIINGYKVQTIGSIIKLKKKFNRDKDIKDIQLIENKLLSINSLALAYLGDSVYELYIRQFLIGQGITKVYELQKHAVEYVSAKKQCFYLEKMLSDNFLTDKEKDIVMRARNHKSHASPKNTDIVTYKYATGLEALIGYLYLKGELNRLNNIINYILREG